MGLPYIQTWGGGGNSVPVEGETIPSWTISSFGSITAKITYTGVAENRPKIVILTVYSRAAARETTCTAANGLGSALVQNGIWKISEGIKFFAVTFPQTGDLNYSVPQPTASASTNNLTMCGTSVDVLVTASAVRINLDGVVNSITDRRLLIGQQLKGTLSFGGNYSPGTNPVTYTWVVTCGTPFSSYVADGSSSQLNPVPTGSTTSNVFTSYFAKEQTDIEIKCTVVVAAHSLSFDVTNKVTTKVPDRDQTLISFGAKRYLPLITLPPASFRLLTNYPVPGTSLNTGIADRMWVTTPGPWATQGYGTYSWIQTVRDFTTISLDGAAWLPAGDPTLRLDKNLYPLPIPLNVNGSNLQTAFPADGAAFIDDTHLEFFRDSPGRDGLASIAGGTFQFSLGLTDHKIFGQYVMYTPPSNGQGAPMAVPLRVRNWWSKGTFMFVRPDNWGTPNDDSSFGSFMDFPPHPIWPFP